MTRSKKVFLGFALLFFASLLFIIYDISRRTTFPGSKTRQKEEQRDVKDSAQRSLPPNNAAHPR